MKTFVLLAAILVVSLCLSDAFSIVKLNQHRNKVGAHVHKIVSFKLVKRFHDKGSDNSGDNGGHDVTNDGASFAKRFHDTDNGDSGRIGDHNNGNNRGSENDHTPGHWTAGKRSDSDDGKDHSDTSVGGSVDHGKDGNTHGEAHVSHTSEDGKTTSEAHVDHDDKGTSYGGSFETHFGKRLAELERLLRESDTTVGGHAEHTPDKGNDVGVHVSHTSDNDKLDAHVSHSDKDGTQYGGSYSHTFHHTGGANTDVSVGVDKNDHETIGGIHVTQHFGKREADIHKAFNQLEKLLDDYLKNGKANVTHISEDGKSHSEAHIDHDKNGTSYGGSFETHLGKRWYDNHNTDHFGPEHDHTPGHWTAGKRSDSDDGKDHSDTSVGGSVDHGKDGNTHGEAHVSHTSEDGKTTSEAHVDHDDKGTSYGGSFETHFGKRFI